MTSPNYVAVGHTSTDVLGALPRLGGTVVYASGTALAYGLSVGVATVGSDCVAVRRQLELQVSRGDATPESSTAGVSLCCRPVDGETRLELRYYGAVRSELVRSVAPDMKADDLPTEWRTAPIVHLAPIVGEVPASLAAIAAPTFLGVTAQGFLRRVANGRIEPGDMDRIPVEVAQSADAVVMSESDVQGGLSAVAEAAGRFRLLVVTRGSLGAVAFSDGSRVEQPALPARVVDPTGAGDVFAATLFIRLWEGASLVEGLAHAAAAGAIAVESSGPLGFPTRAAVGWRLAQWVGAV